MSSSQTSPELVKPGFLRRTLLLLAYSNVLISLEAAGFAAAALVLAGAPLQARSPLLAFCSVFFVYTYDKLASFDPQDALNDPLRTGFLKRWRGVLLGAAALSLGLGLLLSLSAGWLTTLLFLSPVLIGVLYAVPLLPQGFPYRRLKEVTGLKSAAVSLAWALGTGLAPLTAAGVPLGQISLLAAGWIAARLFIATVYFDLGDVRGDRSHGVRTLPVVLGFRRTRVLLLCVNALAGAAVLALTLAGILPPAAHALNLLTLYGFYYLAAARSEATDLTFLCDVVVDAEGVLAGLLALAGQAVLGS